MLDRRARFMQAGFRETPCDGKLCANRRKAIETEQSGREYLIRDQPGLPISHTALYA